METFGKEEGRGTTRRRGDATVSFPSAIGGTPLLIHPSVCLSNIEASALSACEAGYIGLLRESWARHVCAVLAQIVRTRVNLCRRGLLTCPSQSQVCRYVVSLVARHRATGMQPPSLASDIYLSLACSRIRISVPHGGTHSEQMRETGRHIKAGIICYPT